VRTGEKIFLKVGDVHLIFSDPKQFNGQQLFSHIFTRLGDLHLVLSARWKMQGFRVPRCSGQRRANTPALD
jgi:hypothetical protein